MNATPNPQANALETPADVLRAAASYLEDNGWRTHSYLDVSLFGAPGYIPIACEITEDRPATCATGAIRAAMFGHPVSCTAIAVNEWASAMLLLVDVELAWWLFEQWTPWEYKVVPAVDFITAWNDNDGQTGENVAAALRACADRFDIEPEAQPAGADSAVGDSR